MSWLIIIVRIPFTSGLYAYMPYPSCYIGLYIKSEQDLGFVVVKTGSGTFRLDMADYTCSYMNRKWFQTSHYRNYIDENVQSC